MDHGDFVFANFISVGFPAVCFKNFEHLSQVQLSNSATWESDCQQLLKAILLVKKLPGRCFRSSRVLVTSLLVELNEISDTLLNSLLDLLNGAACH